MKPDNVTSKGVNRRIFLAVCSGLGLASTGLPAALAAVAPGGEAVTLQMMEQAEALAGLSFTLEERREIVERLSYQKQIFQALKDLRLGNQTPSPLHFNPLPAGKGLPAIKSGDSPAPAPRVEGVKSIEDAAFLPVTELSALLAQRQITSLDLTRMYLARLKKFDPVLKCVVTLTEDLAIEQAKQADSEIAAGKHRGPLHGIPWGVKDLFATKGIPTSWGMEAYKDRVIDQNASVVDRLEKAGAVLVAKLSLGELATGDRWFGGRTRNPWNPKTGSGGSSAGSASAAAAGLVGFALGTETNNSLVGPAMVCGNTGLRPTFGRVSRYGVMTVAWSFDKIGPLCRSAEDCALVLDAIAGRDDRDHSTVDLPCGFNRCPDVRHMKVGYVRELLSMPPQNQYMADILNAHKTALKAIGDLGVQLVPLPPFEPGTFDKLVYSASICMAVEAAAAHEDLMHDLGPEAFKHSNWPERLRAARFIPAVEYVQASRARSVLMQMVEDKMGDVDVLLGRLTVSSLQGNLTGHPELVMPYGLNAQGLPVSIILTGNLYEESKLIALGRALQNKTGHYLRQPPNFT
ncbi:Amidase [Desulfatibacillum aliphaticivorans]|uniref:Amidase n=1 Tax=Desulfatibacillum aliphaticivorans TaxID=218208 RepID=B8FJW9_DESAL|nr:amidase [Desulfatibacillum aliphaticivorans]ACL02397.1 Amidase [Desulfatibacillum aliphaticivorans]